MAQNTTKYYNNNNNSYEWWLISSHFWYLTLFTTENKQIMYNSATNIYPYQAAKLLDSTHFYKLLKIVK